MLNQYINIDVFYPWRGIICIHYTAGKPQTAIGWHSRATEAIENSKNVYHRRRGHPLSAIN